MAVVGGHGWVLVEAEVAAALAVVRAADEVDDAGVVGCIVARGHAAMKAAGFRRRVGQRRHHAAAFPRVDAADSPHRAARWRGRAASAARGSREAVGSGVEGLFEGVDDGGVEAFAGGVVEVCECAVVVECWLVGAAGGDRGVGVAGGDDAGFERDLVAGEAVGVAGAVVVFVVVADAGGGVAQARQGFEDGGADFGVSTQRLALVRVERVGAVKDLVGDRELADVVQPAREPAAEDERVGRPSWRATSSARSATCWQCRGGTASRMLAAIARPSARRTASGSSGALSLAVRSRCRTSRSRPRRLAA